VWFGSMSSFECSDGCWCFDQWDEAALCCFCSAGSLECRCSSGLLSGCWFMHNFSSFRVRARTCFAASSSSLLVGLLCVSKPSDYLDIRLNKMLLVSLLSLSYFVLSLVMTLCWQKYFDNNAQTTKVYKPITVKSGRGYSRSIEIRYGFTYERCPST